MPACQHGRVDRDAEVLEAAEEVVGAADVVADMSWSDLGLAVVLELRTADGRGVVAKGHSDPDRFAIEVNAYRRWVPAIGDRAPELIGINDAARVIVMSRVDAERPAAGAPVARGGDEHAAYRDAGQVLRRFHESDVAVDMPTFADDQAMRLEGWIERAPAGLLTVDEIDLARRMTATLAHLPSPRGVVCHGDWQPRNWLVPATGEVFAVDFERAGHNWWAHDLQRMWWRQWADRPDLAEAFLEGYGRALTDVEHTTLMATSAAGHITQIVWATEHRDAPFAEAGRSYLRRMAREIA